VPKRSRMRYDAKYEKVVLVHSCFNAHLQKSPCGGCSCKKKITIVAARERISRGVAIGATRADELWIAYLGKETRTPRGPTIERAHIERAYVTGTPEVREREQTRIEEYGALAEGALAELGAGLRVRGKESPRLASEVFMETAGESVLRLAAIEYSRKKQAVQADEEIFK